MTRVFYLLLVSSVLYGAAPFPNVCDVVKTSQFRNLVNLRHKYRTCGYPIPRPCVEISYQYPRHFIEVVGGYKKTYFRSLPFVGSQLSFSRLPGLTGVDNDSGSFSFNAHVIRIPFANGVFAGLPCSKPPPDLFCLSVASEHLGLNWRTGSADLWQPKFQAWSVSPKACLLKGAATSIHGSYLGGVGQDVGTCSLPIDWLPKYPPSNQPVCTGWGVHFPRSGTVTSSDATTASLVVASRIKSLGSEVFQSVRSAHHETWQMIYPHASAGFKEGQNIAFLRARQVHEAGRLRGRTQGYLYAIWEPTRCTVDIPWILQSRIWLEGLDKVCAAVN